MTSFKEIARTSVKRIRDDDHLMPREEHLVQEGMHSLKPQTHKFFKPIRTASSSDLNLSTMKQTVSLRDTLFGSEDDSKDTLVNIGSKHDKRKSPVEVEEENSRGLKNGSREFSTGIPTICCRNPRVTLQMRPNLTSIGFRFLQDETFYEGEPICQHLPHQAVVGTINPDDALIVTPTVYPSPAALSPPPPSPSHTEGKNNDILRSCVPKDLNLPFID